MFCPKCGKENKDGARFCSGCGNPLKPVSGQKPGPQTSPEPKAGPSSASRPALKPSPTPKAEPKVNPAPKAAPSPKPARKDEDKWIDEIQIEYKGKTLPEPPKEPVRKSGKKWKLIGLAALLVILLAAAAVGASMFLVKNQGTGEQKETTLQEAEALPGEEGEEEGQSQEDGETTAAAQAETEAQAEPVKREILDNPVPAASSQDEGNLFGNTHCYARMVSDGDTVYFRNPLDNEGIYSLSGDGAVSQTEGLAGVYMKDMHMLDGYIYYCKTSPGDVSGAETDLNLYRIKPDGSDQKKLTDISYVGSDGWLSFDAIVDGKCYFSYYTGDQLGYRIARVGCDGSGFEELYMIPGEECEGLPDISIVDGNLYYWTAKGICCMNLQTGENEVEIPGFSAAEYCIYNGRIYYSAGPEQSESSMKIKSMSLSGNDIRELYAAPANQSWMKIIQMSIYRDRIYFVGRSDSEDASISGSLYSCGLDGSDLKEIAPKATWFNIVDSMLYYRFENYADLEAGRKEPMYRVYIGDLEESEDPGEAERETVLSPADYNQGWVQQGSAWYYYENGTMAKSGWKEIEEKSYYFGPDGAMYANTTTPDGYTVGPDGAWVED